MPHCSMRFGSRGPNESPRLLSRLRHRNLLTEKAWEAAVQGLGKAGRRKEKRIEN